MDLIKDDSNNNNNDQAWISKKHQKKHTSITKNSTTAVKSSLYNNNSNNSKQQQKQKYSTVDDSGLSEYYFKPIQHQGEQLQFRSADDSSFDHNLKPQQNKLRGSQSLNSLTLFEVSPLGTDRASSFEYLNYRASGSVFSSSGDSDYDGCNQLIFSDTDNEEEFLSVYRSSK